MISTILLYHKTYIGEKQYVLDIGIGCIANGSVPLYFNIKLRILGTGVPGQVHLALPSVVVFPYFCLSPLTLPLFRRMISQICISSPVL